MAFAIAPEGATLDYTDSYTKQIERRSARSPR